MSVTVDEVLLKLDTYTPHQLEYNLNQLYYTSLARQLKRKFPNDTRTIEQLAKIVQEEITNAKKAKTRTPNQYKTRSNRSTS